MTDEERMEWNRILNELPGDLLSAFKAIALNLSEGKRRRDRSSEISVLEAILEFLEENRAELDEEGAFRFVPPKLKKLTSEELKNLVEDTDKELDEILKKMD